MVIYFNSQCCSKQKQLKYTLEQIQTPNGRKERAYELNCTNVLHSKITKAIRFKEQCCLAR